LILVSIGALGKYTLPHLNPPVRAIWAGIFCKLSATKMAMGLLITLGPLYPGELKGTFPER